MLQCMYKSVLCKCVVYALRDKGNVHVCTSVIALKREVFE